MVKINCPKCFGYGLTPPFPLSVCTECSGVGTITVDDSQSLATINAASQQPIEVTSVTPETATMDSAIAKIEGV